MTKIPVIDISRRNGTREERIALAKEIEAVARDKGFLYVSNHGIDPKLREAIFKADKHFHDKPMEEKLTVEQNEFHRGYQPPNSVQLKVSTKFAAAKKPSARAAFVVRQEVDTTAPGYDPDLPLQGPNLWPKGDEWFKETVTAYNTAVTNLGMSLLPILSLAMGQEESFLDFAFSPASTTLALLHYSPMPKEDADHFGSAPHTDYGFLTILAQDDVGGLEVQDHDGSWISAPPIPNTYVVNIGDILARWTNDKFRSTPHRVRNRNPERDRYSVPFFFDPNLSAEIKVVEGFEDENSAEKFPPVRFGEYFANRLNLNYAGRKTS